MRTEGSEPQFLGIFQRADRFMQDLNMTASPKGPYDLNIIRSARVGTETDLQEPSEAVGPKYSIDQNDNITSRKDSNKSNVSIPTHAT
jgi:hypothetical protein